MAQSTELSKQSNTPKLADYDAIKETSVKIPSARWPVAAGKAAREPRYEQKATKRKTGTKKWVPK